MNGNILSVIFLVSSEMAHHLGHDDVLHFGCADPNRAAVWPSGLGRLASTPLAGRSWVRTPVQPHFSVYECSVSGFTHCVRWFPPGTPVSSTIESQLAITSVPSEVRQWPAKALYDRCKINARLLVIIVSPN